jgi:hypothetical protein
MRERDIVEKNDRKKRYNRKIERREKNVKEQEK